MNKTKNLALETPFDRKNNTKVGLLLGIVNVFHDTEKTGILTVAIKALKRIQT